MSPAMRKRCMSMEKKNIILAYNIELSAAPISWLFAIYSKKVIPQVIYLYLMFCFTHKWMQFPLFCYLKKSHRGFPNQEFSINHVVVGGGAWTSVFLRSGTRPKRFEDNGAKWWQLGFELRLSESCRGLDPQTFNKSFFFNVLLPHSGNRDERIGSKWN